ncbi:MAG: ABC transporter permease [Acidimicrobiia bacterium]
MNAPWQQTWLIARREITERIRSKVFIAGTLVTVAVVVAIIAIANRTDSDRPTFDVAVTAQAPAGLADDLSALGPVLDATVNVLAVPATGTYEASLRDGALDLVATGTEILVKSVPEPDSVTTRSQLVRLAASLQSQRVASAKAGLDPDVLRSVLASSPAPVRGVDQAAKKATGPGKTTAIAGTILTFLFILLYGNWVLTGVVEEKTSRVAEVLFATVAPRRLLAGKVIGIGVVALAQAAAVVIAAVVAGAAVGTNLLRGASGGAVLSGLIWFVCGYALYGTVYAAAGALAGRTEDAQSFSFPIQIPLMVGYILGSGQAAVGTDSALLRVLSLVPLTAPVTMPVRIGLGAAAWWEIIASLVLVVAALLALLRTAEKIYRRGMLSTGNKLKIKAVLRAAD